MQKICCYYRTQLQHEKAAPFAKHTERLFSSDTRQSMKCLTTTER